MNLLNFQKYLTQISISINHLKMNTITKLENLIAGIILSDKKQIDDLTTYITSQKQNFSICEEPEDYVLLSDSYGG